KPMLRKPWESDELNEDWVAEKALAEADRAGSEPTNLQVGSGRASRQGYGTVKISAPGSKLTLNKVATRTLQTGGTLIINHAPEAGSGASLGASLGTVLANKHLQWQKRTCDLFTPLQLETMFEAPKLEVSRDTRPKLVGTPLRRVSGRRPMPFKPPPARSSYLAPQLPEPTQTLDEANRLKKTLSGSNELTNSMRLTHSSLFKLNYDAKTRNCLSALASRIEGNSSLHRVGAWGGSPLRPTASPTCQAACKGSLRKMVSAPALNLAPPVQPLPKASCRMPTPYPPTWQWLRAQVEADYGPSAADFGKDKASEASEEGLDGLDHEWLRQISLEPTDEAHRFDESLQDVGANLSREAPLKAKASGALNASQSALHQQAHRVGSPVPPISDPFATTPPSLWQELFLSEPQEGGRGPLGPDRAADHLKRCGVLPHQVVNGELILIKPSQVGQVPKQVNNMRFNSLQMRWEPIEVETPEEDPFAGLNSLAIEPSELNQRLAALNPNHPSRLGSNASHSTPTSNAFGSLRACPCQPSPCATPRVTPQQTPHNSMSKSTGHWSIPSPENIAPLQRSKGSVKPSPSATSKRTAIPFLPSPPRLSAAPSSSSRNPALYEQAFHGWFIPTSARPLLHPVTQATQTDPNDHLGPANCRTGSGSGFTTSPLSTPKAASRRSSSGHEGPSQRSPEAKMPSPSGPAARQCSANDLQRLFLKRDPPFQQLRLVTLVGVNLSSLKEFSELPNLRLLNVSRNCIRELNGLVGLRLVNLKVDHNLLSHLPEGLERSLPSLERVDLSHNQLMSIRGLAPCAHLRALAATNNRIVTLCGAYPRLQVLKLSANPLGAILPLASFASLHTLYLNHLPSELEIPPYFEGAFPALENLSIRHANLSHRHPIRLTPTLRHIYAEGCPRLVPRLSDWGARLAFLELRRCNLDGFPSRMLSQLPQLVALDLSHNRIGGFPADAGTAHPNLKWLSLAANRIANIAQLCTALLPRVPLLRAFDLRGNPLNASLRLDHPDPNVSAVYQAALRSQLPHLSKLDGRRLL
ncbi:Protein nud1, partial [Massospora cicadina]